MDSVLDYIIANYVWFLVGFVIITMMIIGYVADTTDFWHKKKPKKVKEKSESIEEPNKENEIKEALENLKNKKMSDAISIDAGGINDNLDTSLTDIPQEVAPIVDENLNVPFGDNVSSVVNNNEDLNAPFGNDLVQDITPSGEDLNAPLVDNFADNNAENKSISDESLNIPLESNVSNVVDVNEDKNNSSVDSVFSNVNEVQNFEYPLNTLTVDEVDSKESVDTSVDNSNDLLNDFSTTLNKDSLGESNYAGVSDISVKTDDDLDKEFKDKNLSDNNIIDYDEKIVPEYITEKINEDGSTNSNLDDDIWKF